MNSFRSLVYLPGGANATRVFCRGSGLVQVICVVSGVRRPSGVGVRDESLIAGAFPIQPPWTKIVCINKRFS